MRRAKESSKNNVSFNICSISAQLQEALRFCPIHSDTNNKHNNEVIHLQLIMQLTKEQLHSGTEAWMHVLKACVITSTQLNQVICCRISQIQKT